MSKTHVPNARAKAVGQAHKSGAAGAAGRPRRPKPRQGDKESALNEDDTLPADAAKTRPRRPTPSKPAVQKPQAAQGDDDLMSQPQPFPPIVTTTND